MKQDVPCCAETEVHGETVNRIIMTLSDEDELCDLAELFRVFGDTTRIRILYALFEQELCVCDICASVGMTQSAVSHQLKILKASKLVKYRHSGKSVIYSLADSHVKTIIGQGAEHIRERR